MHASRLCLIFIDACRDLQTAATRKMPDAISVWQPLVRGPHYLARPVDHPPIDYPYTVAYHSCRHRPAEMDVSAELVKWDTAWNRFLILCHTRTSRKSDPSQTCLLHQTWISQRSNGTMETPLGWNPPFDVAFWTFPATSSAKLPRPLSLTCHAPVNDLL